MVWRVLLRMFANNEQLVERLSQSPVMRRAAELTVYAIFRWKQFGYKRLEDIMKSPVTNNIERGGQNITEKLLSLSRRFSSELKAGLKEFDEEMKRRNRPK